MQRGVARNDQTGMKCWLERRVTRWNIPLLNLLVAWISQTWKHLLHSKSAYALACINLISRDDVSALLASVRKANKLKCGLCTMWYEKKSVSYSVPNHRIIGLRRSWNYHQEGRRYESASYKYTNTPICLLCAQFFSESTETTCVSILTPFVLYTCIFTLTIHLLSPHGSHGCDN